jgi:hypothetical protein
MGTITPMDQPTNAKKEIKVPAKKASNSSKPVSGAAMDRKVTRRKNPLKKW